jgi:hypothetical protein
MGNMCSGHRKECLYDVDKSSFGMLCKRPYEKEVVVKFETIYAYNKVKKNRKARKKNK